MLDVRQRHYANGSGNRQNSLPRQRELYEVVLGAQKAAMRRIKPGIMLGSRTKTKWACRRLRWTISIRTERI